MALAPFGHAVTTQKIDYTGGGESAGGVDQSGKPVRHIGQNAVTPRHRPSRPGNEQRQPIERVGDAGQHFGRLIGKQPQPRCACW